MSQIIIEEWRDLWSWKADFLVVSCAYAFGIYNFFRLPFLIWTNGGLAFVAGYYAVLVLAVLPIIIMELTVGQLTGRAPPQAMLSVCPLFKGVGIAHILYTLVWMSITSVLLGYFGLFAFMGGSSIYPWESPSVWAVCPPTDVEVPFTCVAPVNYSTHVNVPGLPSFSSIDLTFKHLVQATDDVNKFDPMHEEGWSMYMLGSVGIVWIVVFASTLCGVRWLGKVAYFAFFLAVAMLITLLVRVLMVSGVCKGVIDQVWSVTDWNVMLKWDFWTKVIVQVFYATGLGFGAYITLGSYNKRSNNLVFDTFTILKVHGILSAGLTILVFGLGVVMMQRHPTTFLDMDHMIGKRVIHQFANILQAVENIDNLSKLWSALLILMIILVMFVQLGVFTLNILATLEDALGESASRCVPRACLSFLICFFAAAISLIHTTTIGTHTFDLVWTYVDLIVPWVILTIEIIAIAYFYCAFMLAKDIRQLVRAACCWCLGGFLTMLLYFAPAAPVYVLVRNIMNYSYVDDISTAMQNFEYVECVGWGIVLIILLPIPLTLLYMIIKTCVCGPGQSKMQKLKYTIISPLRYEVVKPSPAPRYTATAPGYVLLPQQAPMAQPEQYDMYGERVVRVGNM